MEVRLGEAVARNPYRAGEGLSPPPDALWLGLRMRGHGASSPFPFD
jgi:hypothetical protein